MLIELWMVKGFLQPDVKNETVIEETGMSYWKILLQSSSLEGIRAYLQTCYSIHDLVHDLAESMSKATKVINSRTGLVDKNTQVRYLYSIGEEAVKSF